MKNVTVSIPDRIPPPPLPESTSCESERGQKLIKEKENRPTHTPVGYRPFSIQVINSKHDMPGNHDEVRTTQEAEMHLSRCNIGHPPGLSGCGKTLVSLITFLWFAFFAF
jgi:hypothetical protein